MEAYESVILQQNKIIEQLTQQIQSLSDRIYALEQGGGLGPSATVDGDTLNVQGSVADGQLEIAQGRVENGTLILEGTTNNSAQVIENQLQINGTIENGDTLNATGRVVDEIWEV